MANRPARTTKKPTPADDSPSSLITTIKTASCKNLLATATVGYNIVIDDTAALWWQIASNTGGGHFNKDWIRFTDIQKTLAD